MVAASHPVAVGEARRLRGSVVPRCVTVHLLEAAGKNEASPAVPSWNQIMTWLRELNMLRNAEAA